MNNVSSIGENIIKDKYYKRQFGSVLFWFKITQNQIKRNCIHPKDKEIYLDHSGRKMKCIM